MVTNNLQWNPVNSHQQAMTIWPY